ncbi:MAG: Lrp/AsnC family transcriptional regulator [Euryarchaeota archaeon]|nr:Lrp/AsnC family transcriptional regulator [Euryarchaeota archaeon]
MIDEKDRSILRELQRNCKKSTKEIAKKLDMPVSTVYLRIKKLRERGVIKECTAIIDGKCVNKGSTAFILASFISRLPGIDHNLSQREIAERIAKFPEAQEVYIISGDWDILIKAKGKDVEEIGEFVVDKLRDIKGIDKTLTCMTFGTAKETLKIPL